MTETDINDAPDHQRATLLQGLYIDAKYQRQGVGQQLFQQAKLTAQQRHYDYLLVKAQTDATGFFAAQGMQRLSEDNLARQYASRYWLRLK